MMKKICVVVPLLLLPVVCGQVADIITDTFIHYNQLKPWTDAQAFCRQYYSDLFSIKNYQENLNFYGPPGWIGLSRVDLKSPWKWSRGDEIANYTAWAIGEPIVINNCAFKESNSLIWKTDGCNLLHTFSCFDETLILVKENKTWEDALKHCRALKAVDPSKPATAYNNSVYDLVSLITQDDYVNIQKKIQDATTDEVWTGLRFLAGQWFWVSGESVQYKNIQSGPTQGFCGILVKNSTGLVGTSDCKQRRNFVCYRKPLPTGRT